MNFEDSRLYRAIVDEGVLTVASKVRELTERGRDVTICDDHNRTFLHVIVIDHADKFNDPRAVSAVYQLCLAGIDVNARDDTGDTALHHLVRQPGMWRILVALLRCGVDTSVEDSHGWTAEHLLVGRDSRTGPSDMLHWYNKFKPGLWQLIGSLAGDEHSQAQQLEETVERLLQSWCRVTVWHDGHRVRLAKLAAESGHTQAIVHLLQTFEDTNELAVAALAGSSWRVHKLQSKGRGDINTKDHSYQHYYSNSIRVPQPLLAAAWELNDYDIIDALMTYKPDTSILYSNNPFKDRKPLFFHVLNGTPKPDNFRIVHRILDDSDLTRRNSRGQTVLFEAMRERLPLAFLDALVRYGVSIVSRDYLGRSPRDYAAALARDDYVHWIDGHVTAAVFRRDTDRVLSWIVNGYDHVMHVLQHATDEHGRRLMDKLADDQCMRRTAAAINTIPKVKGRMAKLLEAVDNGDGYKLTSYAGDGLWRARNKCGHTVLHRAVLSRQLGRQLVEQILQAYPDLCRFADNMMRTPLHYAYLLYDDSDAIVELLLKSCPESAEVSDVHGRLPRAYSKENVTPYEHNALLRDVTEFESRVYLREVDFEHHLQEAIEVGSLERVEALLEKAGRHVDMGQYGYLLFDSIDQEQPDITTCLIQFGGNPEIWKKYEECDPTDDLCVMKKCHHPVKSLKDRALEHGFENLASFIESVITEKMLKDDKGVRVPTMFEQISNFGLVC